VTPKGRKEECRVSFGYFEPLALSKSPKVRRKKLNDDTGD